MLWLWARHSHLSAPTLSILYLEAPEGRTGFRSSHFKRLLTIFRLKSKICYRIRFCIYASLCLVVLLLPVHPPGPHPTLVPLASVWILSHHFYPAQNEDFSNLVIVALFP